MQLREIRTSQGLKQTEVVQLLKQVEPRADVGVLSRYENGVSRPTPAQFRVLCKAYGKEPGDLFEPADVDYGVVSATSVELEEDKPKTKKKDAHKEAGYRLSVRVPQGFIDDPEQFKEKLQACGYPTVTAWVCQCAKRLEAEYAARQKGKGRPDGATSKAANTK